MKTFHSTTSTTMFSVYLMVICGLAREYTYPSLWWTAIMWLKFKSKQISQKWVKEMNGTQITINIEHRNGINKSKIWIKLPKIESWWRSIDFIIWMMWYAVVWCSMHGYLVRRCLLTVLRTAIFHSARIHDIKLCFAFYFGIMWHSDCHKLFVLMGQGNDWTNKKERKGKKKQQKKRYCLR